MDAPAQPRRCLSQRSGWMGSPVWKGVRAGKKLCSLQGAPLVSPSMWPPH